MLLDFFEILRLRETFAMMMMKKTMMKTIIISRGTALIIEIDS